MAAVKTNLKASEGDLICCVLVTLKVKCWNPGVMSLPSRVYSNCKVGKAQKAGFVLLLCKLAPFMHC